MKKIIFFYFFFFLNLSSVYSNDSIFFLDIDYLINNTKSGKLIINKLQKENEDIISEFKNEEQELKKIEDEITKVKNVISKEELSNKIENLKKKVNIYRDKKKIKSKNYNDLKKNELESFFKKITPLVEEFMKIKSIKIIIDKKNIFIADSNYDITKELVEFLNKNK